MERRNKRSSRRVSNNKKIIKIFNCAFEILACHSKQHNCVVFERVEQGTGLRREGGLSISSDKYIDLRRYLIIFIDYLNICNLDNVNELSKRN